MDNQQVPQTPPPGMPPANPGKGLGVAALVLGIVGLVFCFFLPYVGLPCALVGIILGVIGMKKSKEAGAPAGMAVAGMVCGIIALGLNIVCIICICAAIGAVGGLAGLENLL